MAKYWTNNLAIRSHCPIQINSFVFSAKCSIVNLVVVGTISGPGSGCVRSFEVINLNPDPINLTFPDLPVCLYGLGGQFLNSSIFLSLEKMKTTTAESSNWPRLNNGRRCQLQKANVLLKQSPLWYIKILQQKSTESIKFQQTRTKLITIHSTR